MISTRNIFLLITMILVIGCSKGDSDSNQDIPDTGSTNDQSDGNDDETPVVLNPEPVTLVFPEDKTECNEGTVVDDTWSIVPFRWNPSNNTDYYELWYKVNGNGSWTKEITTETEIEVQILRGKQYQWNVVSRNNQSTKNATSENWNFYNSGSSEENYAPFPATLINPKDGDIINYANSDRYYYFQWDASDLDNDPLTYDLYLGTHLDSLNVVKTLSETRELMSNHIDYGIKYYWKIKTSDSNGNSSLSEVWSFTRY